jgi:hypothetical protein
VTLDRQLGSASLIIAVVVTVYALWRIWRGEVKPHAFSVFIWFVLTIIAFVNMQVQGAGDAAWRTGFMAFALLLNLLFSTRHGFGYIMKMDWYFLFAGLLTIPVWLDSGDPDVALLWLLIVDLAGTFPTVRKAYELPFELSPGIYFVTATAQLLQFLSLCAETRVHSLMMYIYMAVFPAIFYGLSGMLVVRRRTVTAAGARTSLPA